jgi:hypothetical protein
MTNTARPLCSAQQPNSSVGGPAETTVRLVAAGTGPLPSGPCRSPATVPPAAAEPNQAPAAHNRAVRSWPLLVLALPAAVAVWSGWVGIGQMTGFGVVRPLPGIWGSLHLNTAVTLPVGVETYAAYALRAWLSTSNKVSARTRRFAHRSAISSLLLGMAGQIAYHLLTQSRDTHAPWGITTAVSCLPVLVLGMGAALAHLLRADAHQVDQPAQVRFTCRDQDMDRANRGDGHTDHADATTHPDRLAEAQAVAAQLTATGQRISRRTLRRAGIHGSNADLGHIAHIVKPQTYGTSAATDKI